MRRIVITLAGLVCAAAAFAAPAAAYEIDPLTRQPIEYADQTYRPQATAIPREVVPFSSRYGAGTIVISTAERRLYYMLGDGQAIRYGVGVGRPGFEWARRPQRSRMKREWPDWRPPRRCCAAGPTCRATCRAARTTRSAPAPCISAASLYRIHGSNEPETIGQAVSSGCIRMTNEDVIDLYDRATRRHAGRRAALTSVAAPQSPKGRPSRRPFSLTAQRLARQSLGVEFGQVVVPASRPA